MKSRRKARSRPPEFPAELRGGRDPAPDAKAFGWLKRVLVDHDEGAPGDAATALSVAGMVLGLYARLECERSGCTAGQGIGAGLAWIAENAAAEEGN